jgi:Zn-dependent alcohol dehydrogenase
MSMERYVTTAALVDAPGSLSVEEITFEGPDAGQVLVKMRAAGVCHTDMRLHDSDDGWGFDFPMLLGHEGSGVVEAVGEGVEHIQVGDHVAIGCRVPCGNCAQCRRGQTRRCQTSSPSAPAIERVSNGEPVNSPIGVGLFARLIPVDAQAAIVIEQDVPLDKLALLGCAVMTGAGAVLNTADVWPGARVAVIGCGGIGLAAVQGARAANARQVIAVDLSEQKLGWAERLGATDTVNGSKEDVVAAVRSLTGGLGVDFSFEAVGNPTCVEQSIEMLAYGGTATVIGVPQPDASITVVLGGQGFFKNTSTLTVTHGGDGLPAHDLPLYAQMYRDGRLDLDTMVTHEVGLAEMSEGFAHMATGDSIRTIVRFD